MTIGLSGSKDSDNPEAVSVLFHAEDNDIDTKAFNDELSALMYKHKIIQVQASLNFFPMIKRLKAQINKDNGDNDQ